MEVKQCVPRVGRSKRPERSGVAHAPGAGIVELLVLRHNVLPLASHGGCQVLQGSLSDVALDQFALQD